MSQEIVSLNIAELVVSKEPVVVSTVLGSCVSVCLFSDSEKGGGVIHFALPELPDNSNDNPLRYGDYAIEKLILETCHHLGVKSYQLKAKLVGGANNIASEHPSQHVGSKNVEIAKKLLSKHKIPIVGEDVGGAHGRKILFHVQTGRLQVAFVGPGYTRPSAAKAIGLPSKIEKPIFSLGNKESKGKIRVLIVDDSKTIRDLLTKILSQDPNINIVGQAEDPLKAELLLPTAKPDVITLDVHMPRMTGVQWLKTLVPKYKLPVVMITSLELKDGNEVFEALELGAVDYIQKPSMSDLGSAAPLIREKVLNAASAKVRVPSKTKKFVPSGISNLAFDPHIVIAIGSSTGGTEALKEVLTALPKNIPPIVIVQHIPPVFSRAFADRMNSLCPFEVKEAESGDALHSNRVLIAPGGMQMKVIKKPSGLFVEINDDPPMTRHKPSVDYLFQSVADTLGKKTIGIILTGMGSDGTKGLLKMKEKGSMTLSQDEDSCVVYGMPKSAWESGASQLQIPLDEIPLKLTQLWILKKTA
jgi:two-component system chemotaxis response regulator CheB